MTDSFDAELTEVKVDKRKKYTVDDSFFDVIDTQDKAYCLGLLYADGCNYEDRNCIKIDLVQEDQDVLQKIKTAMQYTGELRYYWDKIKIFDDKVYDAKPQARLSFRSKQLSKQLALKGCTSNKTYTLVFPDETILQTTLLNHFIRGYMDGDGGISYWIDNKNTGHKKFQIHFCGTTNMITTISDILSMKFNCYPAISDRYPDRDNNNLQMNICGNRIVKSILDWLYENANIYMERKYNKYLELLDEIKRIDEDDNLYGNAYERRAVINLRTKEIFNTVNGAGKSIGVGGAVIYNRCHKHQGWMYLDEYEQIKDKNSIVIEESKWKPVSIYCVENDIIYPTVAETSRQTGVSEYTIKRQCDGYKTKNDTYHFRYANAV